MKMPMPAPDANQSLASILKKPDIIQKHLHPLVNGHYIHWDKLRYRTPPTELSHEDWWALIKLARLSASQTIPFKDKKNQPYHFLILDEMHRALHEIDLGNKDQIEIKYPITNPGTRDRYVLESLIEEAIASSQLDGAQCTQQVVCDMLRGGRRPIDLNERMILNNFMTMRELHTLKNEQLSRELIFHIHELIAEQTIKQFSGLGRFRRTDESVRVKDLYGKVFHNPPSVDQLEARMEAMCAFANGETPKQFIHPVIRSIIIHFWLAYDHPFIDGNGQTARALFYWSMLRHGYWLFEFVSISQVIIQARRKYYDAFLYTQTDNNDLTYFILYHLDLITKAVASLNQYILNKTNHAKTTEDAMAGLITLNHRQRALVGHALRHPGFRYTIKSHGISHNVVHQTARTDLMDLEKRGLLYSEKVGRTYHFIPTADIEARIAQLA